MIVPSSTTDGGPVGGDATRLVGGRRGGPERTMAGIKSNGRAFWKAVDSDGTSWAVELEGEKGNVDPERRFRNRSIENSLERP